jgi:hypothetical protein
VEAFEKDKASQDLKELRDAFAEVLIPDLNQPEKVADFNYILAGLKNL